MATGVKPRDEENQLTRTDLEAIQDAMKDKKFRDLLAEYCEEVRDPANQALYQKEMTQLEKERGYDITFINPKGGYVIKTSVAGDRKAFINICSNDNIDKPTCSVQEVNGQKGMNWQLPYSLIPPREDYNHKKERCIIYDVVFHPDTLRMAEVNKRFRELVNKTALEGLQKTYNIYLDDNNFRFPKSCYKGIMTPAVIRKEDPNYVPPTEEENYSPEIIEKLYPQHSYTEKTANIKENPNLQQEQRRKLKKEKAEFKHSSDNGYTIPKYIIKQQKSVDFQDYTYHKNSKQYSTIPSNIIIEINLPLLSSTVDCCLDIQEKTLSLISEKPAKYKLNINLPYSVNDDCGNAKFDKSKHMLIVTLPVIRKNNTTNNTNSVKVDSGVESEGNLGSQSDEDNSKESLIVELPSKSIESKISNVTNVGDIKEEPFLESFFGYTLPIYTHNVLDDTVAFTFHVKNTDPDSVKVKKDENKIYIKFTSIGSGFVPIHYAALIMFDNGIKFENVTGEAWDNNVILQLEIIGDVPQKFQIGLSEDSLSSQNFDISHIGKLLKIEQNTDSENLQEENPGPVVEVTNLGTETNIIVSSNVSEYDEDYFDSPMSPKEKEIVWRDSGNFENGAKSILRKPMRVMRSFSESSVDVASSMDYISSDCIPEESSLKKTVRFNDVIAKQFYRYNSSIEGQKKKNQRKKSKKRNQERRKSESEAEDDITNSSKNSKSRLKSALKQRHDSGLADTSDAEIEYKNMEIDSDLAYETANDKNKQKNINNNTNNSNEGVIKSVPNIVDSNGNIEIKSEPTIWESNSNKIIEGTSTKDQEKQKPELITCGNIKHNTDFYDPNKLNKGQYQEVNFKNDLIFDLDM